ncbi:10724_t:CDS:2, partial [Entrophospora sp. SA101]
VSATRKLQPKKILTFNAATAATACNCLQPLLQMVADVAEKVATRALKPAVAENVKTVTDINFITGIRI